jgi:uncharacterized membrane protein
MTVLPHTAKVQLIFSLFIIVSININLKVFYRQHIVIKRIGVLRNPTV